MLQAFTEGAIISLREDINSTEMDQGKFILVNWLSQAIIGKPSGQELSQQLAHQIEFLSITSLTESCWCHEIGLNPVLFQFC